MPRRLPTLWAGISLLFILLAVAACGGSSAKAPPSAQLFKPQPGHVTTNPTAAQAFIYLPRSTVKEANGDILITDGGNWDRTGGKVVELNPQGKPVWVYYGGLVFPHAAYPVGKNDIVIADTGNDRVIVINRQGKTVWNSDNLGGGKGYLGQGKLSNGARLLYPNDAYPEPAGRILISSRYSSAVYDVDRSGKVVWSCARFMSRQHNARLLKNGNLTVADSDNARVIIVNHSCTRILFSYGGTNPFGSMPIIWPRTFQPYPGGNFIVGDAAVGDHVLDPSHNRLIEINRTKQIVWQWTNLPQPFYATVLPDGDILTQDSNIHGAVLLGAHGGIVRQYPTVDPRHYPTAVVNPGFELVQPRGWLQGDLLTETLPAGVRANMAFDTSVHHSGKSSGRITWNSPGGHLSLFWFQTLSVTPGKTYNFSGWMKTKNVQACNGCDYGVGSQPQDSAVFAVIYLRSSSPYNPSPSGAVMGNPQAGTQDWTQQTGSFTVPAGVTQVQITCRLLGRGTVWFDDVTIH
jgi:hypothetical protein